MPLARITVNSARVARPPRANRQANNMAAGMSCSGPGRRGQQHVDTGVDQTIVALANVVKLIEELEQAEQDGEAGRHQQQRFQRSNRDITLESGHQASRQGSREVHVNDPIGTRLRPALASPPQADLWLEAAPRSAPGRAMPAQSTNRERREEPHSGPRFARTRRAGNRLRKSGSRCRPWCFCVGEDARATTARPTSPAEAS